jgi:predicted N-acetyltransferase YhbS
MNNDLILFNADTATAIARLRALAAAQGEMAARTLERHLARPRYRPAFTRVAQRAGELAGYALIGHERLRLGTATLEAGRIAVLAVSPEQRDGGVFEALLGDCLRVLVEEELPLALLHGSATEYGPFGFAEYGFISTAEFSNAGQEQGGILRSVSEDDLEDLAALYESCYGRLPLAAIRAAPDWRSWLGGDDDVRGLEDSRGRLVAYAMVRPSSEADVQPIMGVAEAAAADAGAARSLCQALLGRAHAARCESVRLALSPWHPVARAALYLGGTIWLECPRPSNKMPLAGVAELPMLLEALVPEFERRLAGSRYDGWSGNLRVEIETERVTLALDAGRATVIDGSRPADLRLRQVALPALAQLLLGYRAAADLRATGGLACDDSALGLLDTLFPVVMPTTGLSSQL